MTDEGPLTVLHIIPGLGIGGAESMLTALATAQTPGIRPVVVNLFRGGEQRHALEAAGVEVHDLGLTHAIGAPRAVLALARLIRRVQPDAVQGWMYYGDLFATWALRRSRLRASTRLYWGVRCSDMDLRHYGRALRFAVRSCARLSAEPDVVIANSEAGKAVHVGLGYQSRAWGVIPNGIDIERFRPDPTTHQAVRTELGIANDTLLAILPARVDPMKDHETFLAALEHAPTVVALAAGTGTLALPRHRRLITLGPRSDMPRLYAAADMVVLSSAYGEGFPNVLAEGMAAGLPAIATDVGDSRTIVGDCGHLVAPRDPAALAAAMTRLSKLSNVERTALGKAARARIVERFSLGIAVKAFAELYQARTELCAD